MNLLVADKSGTIYDHPFLMPAVAAGAPQLPPPPRREWAPLPAAGSMMLSLPGRHPIGYDPKRKVFEVVESMWIDGRRVPVFAVGAVFPTGFTRTHLPAYQARPDAPLLPLYAYTAVAFDRGETVGLALPTEIRHRWDPELYFRPDLQQKVDRALAHDPDNRLLAQVARCALEYGCYNAQNIFYGRWEGGMPVSAGCNSRCIGCISLQDKDGPPSPQERVGAPPTVDELARVTAAHLAVGPYAQVSFGQGCEGEPTLRADIMEETMREARRHTQAGTLHVNTNGSRPQFVPRLVEAGLHSARVSLNAATPAYYDAYYRPIGYSFEDVRAFIRALKAAGGFVSLNLLVFPGVSDRPEEVDALCALLREDAPDMIQPRNLCIDPARYLGVVGPARGAPIGMRALFARLRAEFPNLALGNFNVPREEFAWARRGFQGPPPEVQGGPVGVVGAPRRRSVRDRRLR